MTIIYGLLGLSLIIFIHELGHFIAARCCGVEVESFSIGMGPILLHKKIGKTDYRLSLIPLGGYCGMKGEKAFQEALDNKLDAIPEEENSFYGVAKWKRIIIAFAGPASNFVFAIIAFTIISMIGTTYYSTPNKVIMIDEVYQDLTSPAKVAGLQTGDKIIAIDGVPTPYFSDISQNISMAAREELEFTIDRNGEILTYEFEVELDKDTGAGRIGITNWVDTVINSIVPGSNADLAGLQNGDIITKIENFPISNSMDFSKIIQNRETLNVTYIRNGIENNTRLSVPINEQGLLDPSLLGFNWKVEQIKTKTYSFFGAIGQGVIETVDMLAMTVKSLGMLFSGIDLTKAVSGPIGITMMLGETTKESFAAGFSVGIVNVLNFLALISVSLFLMNLLPIPILDGGIILVAIIEIIRRKPVNPKILYRIQFIGLGILLFLFIIGFVGDIRRLFTGGF